MPIHSQYYKVCTARKKFMQWEVQQEEIQLLVNSIRFIEEQKYRTLENHVLQSFGTMLVNNGLY